MSDTAKAGFCRQCGQNVWLTPEGTGYCGHPASEIENVYETPVPATVPEPTPVVVPAPIPEPAPFAAPVQPPFAAPVQPPTPSGPKKSPLKWILVAVGVLVVLALAVVFFPRPRFVASSFEVPESISAGEDALIAVDLANEGLLGGKYDLRILIDGAPAESTTVELGAGDTQRVEIPVSDLSPGTYDLALADWEDLTGTLWVKSAPEFVIENVSIDPNPMDVAKGSKAKVLVSVSNTGETSGDYTLSLEVDGTVTEEKDVFVAGGATAGQTFDISIDGPGDRRISVNGASVDLPVYKLERPANGKVLVNKLKGGSNRVKVVNNFNTDYLVVLAAPGDGKPALLSIYVRAKSSATVNGIKSGTYACYYAYGTDWCTYHKQFTAGDGYGKFESNSKYTSSSSQYTVFTYTFGTSGSGAATDNVSEDAFPDM